MLPAALGVPTEVVYLAMVAALPVINFAVFRYVIFHAKPAAEDQAAAEDQTSARVAEEPAPVSLAKGD